MKNLLIQNETDLILRRVVVRLAFSLIDLFPDCSDGKDPWQLDHNNLFLLINDFNKLRLFFSFNLIFFSHILFHNIVLRLLCFFTLNNILFRLLRLKQCPLLLLTQVQYLPTVPLWPHLHHSDHFQGLPCRPIDQILLQYLRLGAVCCGAVVFALYGCEVVDVTQ